VIAVLVNRTNANAENQLRELSDAARTLGLQLPVLSASSEQGFDAAFAAITQMRAGALLVAADPFFFIRRENSPPSRWLRGYLRSTSGASFPKPAGW
jgi:hypothetical protein